MAEVLLKRRLDEAGVDADVVSAGFLADGEPATDEAIETVEAYGLDLSEHRSRVVTPDLVAQSDLIVTMTAQHVARLAGVDPQAWPRAFPLRDLLRRTAARGPRLGDEPVLAWAARLGDGRTPRDVLSAPADDDIADPIGLPLATYQRCAAELDELLGRLAAALAGRRA